MMWHDGYWSGEDWLWMGLGMLLFWTLVVAGVVWLVRTVGVRPGDGSGGVSMSKPQAPARSSARKILDERFARGELSDEEYRQRRDLLAAP